MACSRLRSSFLSVLTKIKQHWKLTFLVLFLLGLCLSLILGSYILPHSLNISQFQNLHSQTKVIRIGHQPHGALLYLKNQATLEKRLASMGFSVEWTEFSAGRQILEAMGEGKIDLGYAGVIPPIFAQANGVDFVYIANDSSTPESMGILVPKDSPIRTLADLKGKKITATKASAGQYLLIQALSKGGLTLKDIEFVDLLPPQGKAAFKQGKVDVWAGWNPFLAELQENTGVRLLTNTDGLMNDRNFYVATRSFANDRAEIIKIVIEEAHNIGSWITNYPEQAAQLLTTSMGMKPATALIVTKSRRYDAIPIQDRAIEEQQRIAETFFRLGLLKKRIWVEDAVWKQGFSQWGPFQ